MAGKRYGLLLKLEGAPATPHVIAGLPGHYRPDVPAPVGEEGDALSLDQAKEAVKSRKDVLELVAIADTDVTVEQAEAQARRDRDAARRNLADAARIADGAEHARVADERQAVKSTANSKE